MATGAFQRAFGDAADRERALFLEGAAEAFSPFSIIRLPSASRARIRPRMLRTEHRVAALLLV